MKVKAAYVLTVEFDIERGVDETVRKTQRAVDAVVGRMLCDQEGVIGHDIVLRAIEEEFPSCA